MATPVYLFTGFLDSGKTTLIKDTLSDPNFMEGVSRTLIVCFEQGEEEYEEDWLNDHHAFSKAMHLLNMLMMWKHLHQKRCMN